MTLKTTSEAKYRLETDGRFTIENYHQSRLFCNFFPGIAGVWGIPMWVFYVNRGQCISSFGIESKDKSILEFNPANKAYRLTSLQGFRTFIKVKTGSKTIYWEPFQTHLHGTQFSKRQTMSITPHDLTLVEVNDELGITVEVNYFTLPEEDYPALVRTVNIRNTGRKNYELEMVDGLPGIMAYGLREWANKNMSRTAEAWITVRNLRQRAAFYQLNVEIADTSVVTPIKDGNFFFSFDREAKGSPLLPVIAEAAAVFGPVCDFLAPELFLQKGFKVPQEQQTSNRTPSALSYAAFKLRAGETKNISSLFGYAHGVTQLNKISRQARKSGFLAHKAERNKQIIGGVKDFMFTKSSSHEFDLYAGHTFLDNVMRGGLPVTLKSHDGTVALNVFSRKHGDLERDYNHFVVKPSFFSQGNGNYRDVNQNRRNDVWFNESVHSSHIVNFLNLSQADGYNPLVVKGSTFLPNNESQLRSILGACVAGDDVEQIMGFAKHPFMPGELLLFITAHDIRLKVSRQELLSKVLEICRKEEQIDEGEGFWTDHWTYNLDLIESYLAIYPEELKSLLLKGRMFQFFHNRHYVLPRNRRYVLTERGVRQYKSVVCGNATGGHWLKTKHGRGDIYQTNLISKLLCLIANKVAALDPSGIGVEMEADKPNWYDALNGLPGLLGSSVSETYEVKRLSGFLSDALNTLKLADSETVKVFDELANFISGLSHVLSTESASLAFWQKANDLKEHYRAYIRDGVEGVEQDVSIADIKHFLKLVIARTDAGIQGARDERGNLATYFYHEVIAYEDIERGKDTPEHVKHVLPTQFKKHALPLFLEGYVHALRVEQDPDRARKLHAQVRKSGLYDRKLKMYKVNADIAGETDEIGRTRIFPRGWLENESIWLHMEYKYILELLRCGLYEEFYEDFKAVLVPFLNAQRYGRSILENSSFLVSSVHADESLHGQGFVARLSGSTAEFIHIWLLMSVGARPFSLDNKGQLQFSFKPALPGWLFTSKESAIDIPDQKGKPCSIPLPKNVYAFRLFCSILVVYHNPHRRDIFGEQQTRVQEIRLSYPQKKDPVTISSGIIPAPHAQAIRDRKIERIDVFFA